MPVVPVILHTPLPFMAKLPGSIFPRRRNDYRIRFLDPEIPRADDDADALVRPRPPAHGAGIETTGRRHDLGNQIT